MQPLLLLFLKFFVVCYDVFKGYFSLLFKCSFVPLITNFFPIKKKKKNSNVPQSSIEPKTFSFSYRYNGEVEFEWKSLLEVSSSATRLLASIATKTV